MRGKDVCAPYFVLFFGLVLLSLGLFLLFTLWYAALLPCMMGLCLILIWTNQWVVMVDEDTFLSSSMFGKKRTLYFRDICTWVTVPTGRGAFDTLVMKSCHIDMSGKISERFRTAVEARLSANAMVHFFLNSKVLEGFCLPGIYGPRFTAIFWKGRRTTFRLTEDGIYNDAKIASLHCSWQEVSLIQVVGTAVYPRGRVIRLDSYYVFIKGRENALIRCAAAETFHSITCNPNRLLVPANCETTPVVLRLAEQKGIPIAYLPSAKPNK